MSARTSRSLRGKVGHSKAAINACFVKSTLEAKGRRASRPWGAYLGDELLCSSVDRERLERDYPESEGYRVTRKVETPATEGVSKT